MNKKAMAESGKWKGYLCYEAGKAAACKASCPPHILVGANAGVGEVVHSWWGAQSPSHVLSYRSGVWRAVDSGRLRSSVDL